MLELYFLEMAKASFYFVSEVLLYQNHPIN